MERACRGGSERTCSPGTRARNLTFPEARFDHEFSVRARSGLPLDLVHPFVLLHLSSLTASRTAFSRQRRSLYTFVCSYSRCIISHPTPFILKPRVLLSGVNDKRGPVRVKQSSSGFSMISRNGIESRGNRMRWYAELVRERLRLPTRAARTVLFIVRSHDNAAWLWLRPSDGFHKWSRLIDRNFVFVLIYLNLKLVPRKQPFIIVTHFYLSCSLFIGRIS